MPAAPMSSQIVTSLDPLGKFSLHPRADIILRSCDSHDFPVQKLYVIDSSPVLGEQIMATMSQGASVGPEGELLLQTAIRREMNISFATSKLHLLSFSFPRATQSFPVS